MTSPPNSASGRKELFDAEISILKMRKKLKSCWPKTYDMTRPTFERVIGRTFESVGSQQAREPKNWTEMPLVPAVAPGIRLRIG
jgi:hypothetical protein